MLQCVAIRFLWFGVITEYLHSWCIFFEQKAHSKPLEYNVVYIPITTSNHATSMTSEYTMTLYNLIGYRRHHDVIDAVSWYHVDVTMTSLRLFPVIMSRLFPVIMSTSPWRHWRCFLLSYRRHNDVWCRFVLSCRRPYDVIWRCTCYYVDVTMTSLTLFPVIRKTACRYFTASILALL